MKKLCAILLLSSSLVSAMEERSRAQSAIQSPENLVISSEPDPRSVREPVKLSDEEAAWLKKNAKLRMFEIAMSELPKEISKLEKEDKSTADLLTKALSKIKERPQSLIQQKMFIKAWKERNWPVIINVFG